MLQQVADGRLWADVLLSVVLGGAIGLERQLRGKPAGIRTSILICLGAVVFVRLGRSLAGPGADPTRVLGQVATGIGFLGGGVILRQDGLVHGVTSAAIIWLLAAIGCAIGVEQHGTAIVMTLAGVAVSAGLEALERAAPLLSRGVHHADGGRDAPGPDPGGSDDRKNAG